MNRNRINIKKRIQKKIEMDNRRIKYIQKRTSDGIKVEKKPVVSGRKVVEKTKTVKETPQKINKKPTEDVDMNDRMKRRLGVVSAVKVDLIHNSSEINKYLSFSFNENSNIKVLLLSFGDYAGSGYRIKECIKKFNNNIDIISIYNKKHKYGYAHDIIILNNLKLRNHIQKLINDCDIIHFKGDDLPTRNWYGFDIPKTKKIILTVGGSIFRRGKKSEISLSKHPIDLYRKITDVRTAITPDLNYPEYDGIYSPHVYDTKKTLNIWNNADIPIIQHSPSKRSKKGTNNIILPAIKKLKNDGFKFELDIIENVSNVISVERKKNGTIFIDQINGVGFYGVSAIESMQYGVPLFTFISEKSYEQSNGIIDKKTCPIVNVSNIETLYNKLKYYLENRNELAELSIKTKEYVDKIHSFESNYLFWTNIYNEILK